MFIRPEGDLEKALENIPKLSTDDLLIRFRTVMPINEVLYYLLMFIERWRNYDQTV